MSDDLGLTETLLASYRRAIQAVAAAAGEIRGAARILSQRWERGGRLIYVGAGASGLNAAEDAAELPCTFGLDRRRIAIVLAGGVNHPFRIDAAAEDDRAAAARDLATFGDMSLDSVIAVSASGSTPFTLAAVEAARSRGAYVTGLASRAGAPLLAAAHGPLLIDSGEEAIPGSTRLAAGVGQKAALGMMSTLFGLNLGHLHQGLMVNLRVDNDKLRRRAVGVVVALAGVSELEAKAALCLADDDVKQATLIAAGAGDAEEARARLAAAGERLGEALDSLRG